MTSIRAVAVMPGRAAPAAPAIDDPTWLIEVRLRMARRVGWVRSLWNAYRYDGEDLLGIAHSEVDRALSDPTATLAAERDFYRDDAYSVALTDQLDTVRAMPRDRRWHRLVDSLGVSEPDEEFLAVLLATAAYPALRRVCGYLLDRTDGTDPTPALAAALFDRAATAAGGTDSALSRWQLAWPAADGDRTAPHAGWVVDVSLLSAVLGSGGRDPRLLGAPPYPALRPDEIADAARFIGSFTAGPGSVARHVVFLGPPGSGRGTLGMQVAAALDFRVLEVHAGALLAAPDPEHVTLRAVRDARLSGALLLCRDADALPESVWQVLDTVPCVVTAAEPLPGRLGSRAALRRQFEVPPPRRSDRLRLWAALASVAAPAAVTEWTLRPGEIVAAANAITAGPDAVTAVCRDLLMAATPELLTKLPSSYVWSDLVVAPATDSQLRELAEQARDRGEVLDTWGLARLAPMGRGVTALFAGPSGTGKTMAAQVLANELGLDVYRVDLAGVVNKYIGETEKRLRQVFDACERAPVVLFFDEADALFGKRTQVSDAHDRYANIEIDYLLQQMEQFDGIAILATNRKGDLDSAFVRRLRFIVDFAAPTVEERELMWQLTLADARDETGCPLCGELDWGLLARSLDLTGAGIKSAALAAAFLARSERSGIEMRHVLAAGRRELAKRGVVLRPTAAEVTR